MANQFLIKSTMADLRNLSTDEIGSLQGSNPVFQGVELLGYYEKGDIPSPIHYYISDTNDEDDGGSIIDLVSIKLRHTFGDKATSIKYFGVSNNTDALFNTHQINNCLKACNNVYIDADLSIFVDEFKSYNTIQEFSSDTTGNVINIGSNTTLKIYGSIIFNNHLSSFYRIIDSNAKTNISISGIGGIIKGNYLIKNEGGEHGHGISLRDSSNCVIDNLTITECLGDGIYIGGDRSDIVGELSNNIHVKSCSLDGNGRQGISIVKGQEITLANNKILNTGIANGTVLGCGIDIEPEWKRTIRNINIKDNYLENNHNNAINILILREDAYISIKEIFIENNTIYPSPSRFAISSRKIPGNPAIIEGIYIRNNNIRSRDGKGIAISNPHKNVYVKNNRLLCLSDSYTSGSIGVSIIGVENGDISGNIIDGKFETAIFQESNASNNIFILHNNIRNSLLAFKFRNARSFNVSRNLIADCVTGMDLAGIVNCQITCNIFRDLQRSPLKILGYSKNTFISSNTFINVNQQSGNNTEEPISERSVIYIQSNSEASANFDTTITDNLFLNDSNYPVLRHISSANITNYGTAVLNNIGNELLKIINNGEKATTNLVYNKFGSSNDKPNLPTNYRDTFIDSSSNQMSVWTGTSWTII